MKILDSIDSGDWPPHLKVLQRALQTVFWLVFFAILVFMGYGLWRRP